jgi:hypothetical protein
MNSGQFFAAIGEVLVKREVDHIENALKSDTVY